MPVIVEEGNGRRHHQDESSFVPDDGDCGKSEKATTRVLHTTSLKNISIQRNRMSSRIEHDG
jgi:hypothetical protein